EFASRPRASWLRAAASKSGKQDTRLAAQVTAVSVVTAGNETARPSLACLTKAGRDQSDGELDISPPHATTWLRKTSKRASPGAACLPRRAGAWTSRGLRPESSHGERRVSTAVGRHAPGLGQGRPLRPISGAKRRHDLSSEEPHLLQQQIRGFIL